jgi:hypothetical protein
MCRIARLAFNREWIKQCERPDPVCFDDDASTEPS